MLMQVQTDVDAGSERC